MVRKTNIQFLEGFLSRQGLQKIDHMAGHFTEIYTRLPHSLRGVVYWLNLAYLEFVRFPNFALGNVIIFQKPDKRWAQPDHT